MLKKLLRTISVLMVMALAVSFMSPVWADEEEDEETPGERLSGIQWTILTEKAGKYGMLPVYPRDIKDGTYEVKVDSTSPFFKVRKGEIIVEDGQITARITIASTSYLYVFLGTGADAGTEKNDGWLEPEIVDGRTVFTFPIDALDNAIDCAAYSKARQQWYDRKLVFNASSLPKDALLVEIPDYSMIENALLAYKIDGSEDLQPSPGKHRPSSEPPEPISVNIPDGEYSIEVNLIGGSGRASISSPTLLVVRNGKAYSRLLWSSANYDYMIVDDTYYYNLTTDGGNSVFEIPITVMDDPMSVIADTNAMGDPLEIEYALTFYQDTISSKGKIPQEAAKVVFLIAAVIIVVGGVINYFVKKKRS